MEYQKYKSPSFIEAYKMAFVNCDSNKDDNEWGASPKYYIED